MEAIAEHITQGGGVVLQEEQNTTQTIAIGEVKVLIQKAIFGSSDKAEVPAIDAETVDDEYKI